jgi:LEA14-like dessication related protein
VSTSASFIIIDNIGFRPKHGMVYRITLVLVLVLTLSGCTLARIAATHFEKPTFTFVKSELADTSQSRATVNFIFLAHNPNKEGLKNVSVSYELFVQEKRLMIGSDVLFDLNPDGDTEIKIPAVIAYSDLFPVLGSVAKRFLSGQKTVPITIVANFSGKPALYGRAGKEEPITFEKRFTKTADIPLQQERRNRQ